MNDNMQDLNNHVTDIQTTAFAKGFDIFKKTGNFIAFTQRYPYPFIKQAALEFTIGSIRLNLLDTGIVLITPEVKKTNHNRQKNIIISTGIHGNETAPIEILERILQLIIKKEINVIHRLLFIIGNPMALKLNQRFYQQNLNRLFSGSYKQLTTSFESLRAKRLEVIVQRFFTEKLPQDHATHQTENIHYDLHTAIRGSVYEKFAICPFQKNHQVNTEQLNFLHDCDVNTLLLSQSANTTFAFFTSSHFSAQAFTIELGKARALGENDLQQLSTLQSRLLKLISQENTPNKFPRLQTMRLFKVVTQLIKFDNACHFLVADEVKNFTSYPKGTLLYKDDEHEYRTHQREYIVFPNAKVEIGERLALLVVPCPHSELLVTKN